MCDGFSVSNAEFGQLNAQFPNRFIRLYQGRKYNNFAVSAHPSIDSSKLKKISLALRSEAGIAAFSGLLERYSADARFVPAQKADYPEQDLRLLLRYWQ